MQNGTLIKTLFLKATPEKVWAYLTESDKLAEWFHGSRETLTKGQDYHLLSSDKEDTNLCWGKVLEANPHDKLVYTFTHDHLAGHETTVMWELEAAFGGTQLVMTHSGLDSAAEPLGMLNSHDKGWDDHFSRLHEKVAA
ncbi:MAG: SRPBCC domain-containing protein [Kordiimonadaceae bacterium]|nr:SRPBCC domain-containing protein [Kordiimonadaceae bacterium]